MKLLDILNQSTQYLAARHVPSPRLQAELLMSHVLQMPRLNLYLHFDRIMQEEELAQLRPLLKERGDRKPLQHILGEVQFYGLKIYCSPAALIPRPETEILIDLALNMLQNQPPGRIFDIGTGTGVIAIALASKLAGWRITGRDVSPAALELARKNHALYPKLNIEWQETSLLENLQEKADLVLANLPYLTQQEMNHLEPEVQADPALALDGGKDGLDLIRQLIIQATDKTSRILLEIAPPQAERVTELLRAAGFAHTSIHGDLTGRQRFVAGLQ